MGQTQFFTVRRAVGVCIAAVSLAAAGASPPSALAATRYVECQHPVTTGVEVSNLRHVSTATACGAALYLYSWENKDGHIPTLYVCKGKVPTAVLKLHKLDGWTLSIAKSGYFQMSRGKSAFDVSGTDFPLACN